MGAVERMVDSNFKRCGLHCPPASSLCVALDGKIEHGIFVQTQLPASRPAEF